MEQNKGKTKTAADKLRRKAEERLAATEKTGLEQPQLDGELQRLRCELEINHIELEIQNEELIRSRDEMEVALDKFTDLFESGPVGFLTLSRDGCVKAVSLSSASLLGMDRSQIMGRRFGLFVAKESRILFESFLEKTFADHTKVVCDVALLTEGNAPVFVQLAAKVAESGQECYVALIDITERKLAEETLKKYAKRLIMLEEDLRKGIAADLHDDIAQTLTALNLKLAYIGNQLKGEYREELHGTVADSQKLTKDVSRSVRDLMVELHPQQLEEFGLETAIRSHVEQYANRAGIMAVFNADPNVPRQTAKKETALYRIAQEALQNIMKHANATKVTLSLNNSDGVVRLTIADNGKGFAPKADSPQPTGSGWGLTNMRERAELVGGSLRVHSVVGEGTTIEVEIKAAR